MEWQLSALSINLSSVLDASQGNLYLLLDGADFIDVHAFIYQMEEHPEYSPIYLGTYYESAREVSPCLVKIRNITAPLFEWFASTEGPKKKGILLVSDMNQAELVKRLQSLLEVALPNNNMVIFRFYDPGTFTVLAELHHKPQLAALFHSCHEFYWFSGGKCHRLSREPGQIPMPPASEKKIPQLDQETFTALMQVSRERYITLKVKDLSLIHPLLIETVGEKNLRRFVEIALKKGESHNMTADREVNALYTLMMNFGTFFDTDPQYPWADLHIRGDNSVEFKDDEPASYRRLMQVYTNFDNFYSAINGNGSCHKMAALERTRNLLFYDLHALRDDELILHRLGALYPQRYERLNHSAKAAIIAAARMKAFEYDLDTHTGTFLFALFFFYCGIGADANPLQAHIMEGLEDEDAVHMSREQLFFRRLQSVLAPATIIHTNYKRD